MERGLNRELDIFPDLAAATSAVARHLQNRAEEAVTARGRFSWVLAGGHTPEGLYRLLATRYKTRFPWAETEVFFGDERCVSPRNALSNYAMARAALLSQVPIRRSFVHRLRGEVRPYSRAASEYASLLRPETQAKFSGTARFDVVLLGLGPDGHTASLFPGAPALRERTRTVVAVPRAGQPPWVPRLTMTLPTLASSREVIFLVAGADKATAVAGAFRAPRSGTPKWPASLVHSTGTVRWFVDRTAAAALPSGIRTSSDR